MKWIENKNRTMKAVEEREGCCIEELLRVKFVDQNKQIKQIADELKISYATAVKWLKLAGIHSRKLTSLEGA